MKLTPGLRLRSGVDETEVLVIKAPPGELDLRCGGREMVALAGEGGSEGQPEPGYDDGTLLGKRYSDAAGRLQVLCTKPGAGSLSVADERLEMNAAKPLPSSD